MKIITCLIVDDEPNAVQLLEDYIQKIPYLMLKQKCYDAFEALQFLEKEKVDLVFLDINMPKMSGMELAALLPKGQCIIFTSAYASFALEGYEYNALDYILKPIIFKRFVQAVEKVRDYFQAQTAKKSFVIAESKKEFMFIKSDRKHIKVYYDDILYFEAQQEYVKVVLANDSPVLVYKRMKQLEEQLPSNFIRIHNSFILNNNYLDFIVDNHASVKGEKLPISASYKAKLIAIIENNTL